MNTDDKLWSVDHIIRRALADICQEHNAALAAITFNRDEYKLANLELFTALAAERDMAKFWKGQVEILEQQLNTEGEIAQETARAWFNRNIDKERNELRQQLVAEREKLDRISELIEAYNNGDERPAVAALSDIETIIADARTDRALDATLPQE